jgi:hypothetical protein
MDPATVMMMGMVDQLTTLMAKLATQVEDIASAPKVKKEKPAPIVPKVESAAAQLEAKPEPKPKYYYGVGHGLIGVYGGVFIVG